MKKVLSLLMALCLVFSLFVSVNAAGNEVTPTGYDSADDVVYKKTGNYIHNWGARDEDCVFVSIYGQDFYKGNYSFETLSSYKGGSGIGDAASSALYAQLQTLMKSKHTYINGYSENNNLLKYTDCVHSDSSKLSSFYSGKLVASQWVSGGGTYNKEHTWPNSKGMNGRDEDDVMMIRPTIVSENSSRGNTAYGQSGSYYDPNSMGMDVRGDCARICLYIYTRWGNTGKMWGSSGVIESLDVLLKWMQEDPVDTWEMGRNDAVQSITGTRNAFVDYPEFAWLLFGREVPRNMTTPSGKASGGVQGGNTGNGGGNTGNGGGNTGNGGGNTGNGGGTTVNPATCNHTVTELKNFVPTGCGTGGYTGDTVCTYCGKVMAQGEQTNPTGAHNRTEWVVVKDPTETEPGLKERGCKACDYKETREIEPLNEATRPTEKPAPAPTVPAPTEPADSEPENETDWLLIGICIGGGVLLIGGGIALIVVLPKRKKHNNQ